MKPRKPPLWDLEFAWFIRWTGASEVRQIEEKLLKDTLEGTSASKGMPLMDSTPLESEKTLDGAMR